jgi:hypothetical protein
MRSKIKLNLTINNFDKKVSSYCVGLITKFVCTIEDNFKNLLSVFII